MRVLNVVFDLGMGGVQRTAMNYAVSSVRLGHDSHVLSLNGGVRLATLEESGVNVTVVADARIPRNLIAWKPDVVIIHSLGLPDELVREIRRIWPDAALVEKSVFSTPSTWSDILDYSYQLAPWMQWLYSARGGDATKAPVVPNPVDVSAFAHLDRDGGEFRVRHEIPVDAIVLGRVGQSFTFKWSPLVVRLFDELARKNPALHLLLVGAPDDVISEASRSGASRRIHVVDPMTDDSSLASAYAAMDIFVHIARQGESFGHVLIESAALGVPVVTMATPWADNAQGEVIGSAGITAASATSFRTAVQLLIENREERARLSAHGPEQASLYESDVVTERALNIALGRPWSTDGFTVADARREYRSVLGSPTWAANWIGTSRQDGLAVLTGNESWQWLATTTANRLGISRRGLHGR